MSGDVVKDLKDWLALLIDDRENRARVGELPEIDIHLLSRAIAEIERLREAIGAV